MPLVPPVMPAEVEMVGALFPKLFNFQDPGTGPSLLDALVQFAIDSVDAWMQDHMSGNYGLSQFSWQVTQQRNGQIYLALERLTDTLKAQKTYGTHYPYVSEDSPAYENLIMVDWGQRAMECLDRWVTVEQINRNFAMPVFTTSQPIPEIDTSDFLLDPLSVFYSGLLDRSRGFSRPDIGTVTR